ncbi:hypothetical protein CHLNCDRAFT_138776 [Chlorella variabilis]|uniref:Glycerophosphocholine acyltransferase 1 n=1 Tax=Chlorella variabilis TaxID=554065 RepID=E1ZNQ8_CHLVA|nr:hypothetical protein CHLNCDRAFT_138776 [Chlorella variabilis]EFN52360.1 hypothetical protein CHLNCDRAFT_138776 [Chlorella variabilis]|eukprot:XP_005844462.1 hypothetical protein CHLNCDRAFT_138776 [Chlorella variabilis]
MAEDPPTPPAAAPAGPRRALSRAPTFREQFDSMKEEMQKRLEPMLEAAGTAAEGMSLLLDPATQMQLLDEALAEQPHAAPDISTASGKAAEAAREAREEVAAEARLQKMGGSLIDPHKIMLKDKLAFVFGVVNVVLTSFWVGRWPSTYYWFWMAKDVVLFTLRYMVYKKKGMHYMMLEYCYAANLAAFYYLIFAPHNAFLRKFCFAVMTGPLMWSIVAMRNSLVFHDGDKITTLMMHASPAISAWCMRWHPQASWTAGMTPAELAAFNSASWVQMAIVPAALNVVWVAIYYLLIFVIVNKRIQERGYQNMFTAMVMRPTARKSPLAKLVLSVPQAIQPLAYLGLHTFASWISLVPTKIWFDSYWAHTAILCGILLWATWNGANFYFRVFAKKLMQDQVEKQQAAEAKKAS